MFFVYPVVSIVGRGLAPDWRLDLDPLARVVTDASLRHIAWFTLWQATLSTLLTLAVALPGAYVLARFEFPGRRLVRALVVLPFVLPTVVVGSAFAGLMGPGGPLASLGLEQTLAAILIAHVFFNYAV
ncbi:MAG: iron ABC transporter permease, partial [Acidimicrobiia bacterium]